MHGGPQGLLEQEREVLEREAAMQVCFARPGGWGPTGTYLCNAPAPH